MKFEHNNILQILYTFPIIPMGGKINECNANDNAYFYRNDLFTLMIQQRI